MILAILSGFLELSGCTGATDSAQQGCASADVPVAVTIVTPAPAGSIVSDLLVEGTARSGVGVAVIDVSVAGVPATSVTGGYDAWTATIPYASLLAMTGGLGGSLQLCPQAVDLCGNWASGACDGGVVVTVGVVAEGGTL